jgi:putative phosphoribosyl transferase
MRFFDRADAGRRLAREIAQLDLGDDVLVLGLPRGGVPVAAEVPTALAAPFDVLVVRKLGVPGHEELAFGAIASGGVRVLNDDVVRHARLTAADIERVTERELNELERREAAYRGDRAPLHLEGRSVIVVDDGLATGATMSAAVDALRAAGAAHLTVAVPVGASSTCGMLANRADRVVCLSQPRDFGAVGFWYEDFSPTTDEEVRAALA